METPYILITATNGTSNIHSPAGVIIRVFAPYLPGERLGVTIIVVTAAISLACVLLLLAFLGMFLVRKRTSNTQHFFVKTHAAVYFTCLLIAGVIQAIGSVMSSRWVQGGGVSWGGYCQAQGAIKNAGNLAVSLWTLTLAVNTFMVLFLRWKIRDYALYVTLFAVWFLVAFLVLLGPGVIQKANKGPYFGISGYWCWISDPYPGARVGMEYLWLFGCAGLSFVCYMLTFLRLRGNLVIENGKVRFQKIESENSWKYLIGRDATDIQMTHVAKGMLGFPILFTVTILPIAVCRFIAWGGSQVPFEATIFADAVFSLTGVFDLILFMTTRSLLPADGFKWWLAPRPHVSSSDVAEHGHEHGVQPYDVHDFAFARDFSETYQAEAERTMIALPQRTAASLSGLAKNKGNGNGGNDTPFSLALPRTSTSVPPSRPSTRPPSLDLVDILQQHPHPPQEDMPPIRDARTENNSSNARARRDLDLDLDVPHTPHLSSPLAPPASPATWDDIDLGRRVSPARNAFMDPARRRAERDTQYTAFDFDLSAYGYEDGGEATPPLPLPSASRRLGGGGDERRM